jgi:EmrB/QacA subfamily drug resistance transporter
MTPDRLDSNRTYALWISALASFIAPFLGSSLNIALPSISHEFNLTAVALTWIPAAYVLSSVIFLVPLGRLADIRGRKRVFRAGIMIEVAACLAATMTPSGEFFIALRAVQGLGGAMIFSTGLAILSSVYPPEARGRVLGINVAAVYLGLSLGPVIGGILTQNFGWRSIFVANILMGALILYLVTAKLHGEWAEAKGERFDGIGSVCYGGGFLLVMAGFSLSGVASAACLAGGVAALGIFAVRELRIGHPILDLRLFRNPSFAFSNLAALIHYCATTAIGFLLSLYLQDVKAFTPQHAGLVLLAQPVMMALFSPYAGKLSDRVDPRVVASAGMAITTAGLAVFCFLDAATPVSAVVAALVVVGFGFALFSSPNTNAIMGSVEKRFYGAASGVLGTMRLTGQLFSLGIASAMFGHFLGASAISPETAPLFLQAVRTGFLFFTVLCGVGVGASLARGRMRSEPG